MHCTALHCIALKNPISPRQYPVVAIYTSVHLTQKNSLNYWRHIGIGFPAQTFVYRGLDLARLH